MIRQSDLEGYKTRGMANRLIIKLFVDDTTVYLSEDDRIEDLFQILDEWCLASRAKFNVNKTVLIPTGTVNFRKDFIETRKLGPTHERVPDNIEILPEGTTTRTLGGRVGNNAKREEPWAPILENIDKAFDHWQRTHPTINGKKMIVQWNAGGRTEFLAMVQGMPPEIEHRLEKRIQAFIWESEKKPQMNTAKMIQN
ncbi:hypothetical protein FISHEDRAFT_63951 [Fistulina hepatica ATCC 64428]|uniref:Reverse transcriptase domain-containing protein n=1 Tax=Fistulina hepatica ATCC 64428 TaxID=1128425 RepID=A0A0D7AN69_9AGAR|nr:hypothetical protein FISHEDRAFT_63951 [Fistulina hepatica ATCC 64428]